MKITIELDEVVKAGLTPNTYCVLYCKFFSLDSPLQLDHLALGKLEELGYIKVLSSDFALREKAIKLFCADATEQQFYEFWSAFPMKVPNGAGGSRVLRSKGIDTKDALVAKKKYMALIKKPGEHEKIMKALHVQLQEMRNKLQFFQNVDTWLNQKTYEKYVGLEEEGDKDVGYGGEFR